MRMFVLIPECAGLRRAHSTRVQSACVLTSFPVAAEASRDLILAAVKVKGQARLIHIVKTISGDVTQSPH